MVVKKRKSPGVPSPHTSASFLKLGRIDLRNMVTSLDRRLSLSQSKMRAANRTVVSQVKSLADAEDREKVLLARLVAVAEAPAPPPVVSDRVMRDSVAAQSHYIKSLEGQRATAFEDRAKLVQKDLDQKYHIGALEKEMATFEKAKKPCTSCAAWRDKEKASLKADQDRDNARHEARMAVDLKCHEQEGLLALHRVTLGAVVKLLLSEE